MNSPLISVLILNYKKPYYTIEAISSVKRQTYKNLEIIVVDNNSEDNSIELIRNKYPEINIQSLDKNYGCPGGRNKGILLSKGEYIFFLDDDGLLHKEAITRAYNEIIKSDRIGIVTGTVKYYNNPQEIELENILGDSQSEITGDFQGGVSLHRKKIYSDVGYYPENYIYGSEERNLALRILDKNYIIIKCNNVLLWHPRKISSYNLVSSWFNALKTARELYPIEFMFFFFIKFSLIYPIYAYKKRVLNIFIRELYNNLFEIIFNNKSHRIKRITFLRYMYFTRIHKKF